MKKLLIPAVSLMAFATTAALGQDRLGARLSGYQEVPSVSTPASGEFSAKISHDDKSFEYELSYSNLVGTVQQGHIHFAQRSVNGSIVVWLCQTATTPAPAAVAAITPICPQSGKVGGMITSANVIAAGTTSQLIVAGEIAEVIAAMRAGKAYANIHTTPLNAGGEIRGQIGRGRGWDKDKDKGGKDPWK